MRGEKYKQKTKDRCHSATAGGNTASRLDRDKGVSLTMVADQISGRMCWDRRGLLYSAAGVRKERGRRRRCRR